MGFQPQKNLPSPSTQRWRSHYSGQLRTMAPKACSPELVGKKGNSPSRSEPEEGGDQSQFCLNPTPSSGCGLLIPAFSQEERAPESRRKRPSTLVAMETIECKFHFLPCPAKLSIQKEGEKLGEVSLPNRGRKEKWGMQSRGQKQVGGRQKRGWTVQWLEWTRGSLHPCLPAQVSSSAISAPLQGQALERSQPRSAQ